MSSQAAVDDFVGQNALALVGASRKGGTKFGNIALRELKAKGYRVYPIHPEAESLEGERCYRSLKELPEPVGGVIVSVSPSKAEEVVRQVAEAGIRRVWLQQGAESGDAIRFCKENHIEVTYGECILMYAHPSFFPHGMHRGINRLIGKQPR